MKYFLAIDKGQVFKNSERLIKLNLTSINEKLSVDNNLRALCTFTCSFNSQEELKSFLQAKGLLDKKNTSLPLVITYFRDYYRTLNVPYSKDSQYFNSKNLVELIYKHAKDTNFLSMIINHYSNYQHLSKEIYSLRSYLSNPYADYKLYDVIRAFVDKLCYRQNKNQKNIINFKGMFDLGMLISRILNKSPEKVREDSSKTSLEKQNLSEDDPRFFKLEELKDRYEKSQEDQMRLF